MKSFGVVTRAKAPEDCVGVWVNMYMRGNQILSGGSYERRVDADRIAKPYRHDCVYAHVRKLNDTISKP